MNEALIENLHYLDNGTEQEKGQGNAYIKNILESNGKLESEEYQKIVETLTKNAQKEKNPIYKSELLNNLDTAINKYQGATKDIYTIGQAVTYITETNNLLFKDIIIQKQDMEILQFLIEDYLEEAVAK